VSVIAPQCGIRDLCPYVAKRELEGVYGSMHEWTDGTPRPTAALELDKVQRMRVFDFVSGNRDRHSENVLWRGGAPVPVDHGHAFPSGPPDRFVQPLVSPPGELGAEALAQLEDMDERGLADTMLAGGLDEEAARQALFRLRLLKREPQLLRTTEDPIADERRWYEAARDAARRISDDDRASIELILRSLAEASP
jgi:hypothetical protein